MSAFPPNPANYDQIHEPLTLGGKSAALEHLTPRCTPQQAAQVRQAASSALYAAFTADVGELDVPHQNGGME